MLLIIVVAQNHKVLLYLYQKTLENVLEAHLEINKLLTWNSRIRFKGIIFYVHNTCIRNPVHPLKGETGLYLKLTSGKMRR